MQGVGEPVVFTACCTLGPFFLVCSCKHDFRVLAALSLRHGLGTDLHVPLKLHFLEFVYGINLVFL